MGSAMATSQRRHMAHTDTFGQGVSSGIQQCTLGKLTLLDGREEKQMVLRASPPFQLSSAERFMHKLLFVCRVGEHRAHCVSTAIYQTCQGSLY